MCVIVVIVRRWADDGLWVSVCVLAKISFRRPSTLFARLTQSQAISLTKAFSSLSVDVFSLLPCLFLYLWTITVPLISCRMYYYLSFVLPRKEWGQEVLGASAQVRLVLSALGEFFGWLRHERVAETWVWVWVFAKGTGEPSLLVIMWHQHCQINEGYTNKFQFFIFWNSFYIITVSFTMVIKRPPCGESAGGGRSTSKSTCVVAAWTLTEFGNRSAPSMSK